MLPPPAGQSRHLATIKEETKAITLSSSKQKAELIICDQVYISHYNLCLCSLEQDDVRHHNLAYNLTKHPLWFVVHLCLLSRVTWLSNETLTGAASFLSGWITPPGTYNITVLLGISLWWLCMVYNGLRDCVVLQTPLERSPDSSKVAEIFKCSNLAVDICLHGFNLQPKTFYFLTAV